MTILNCGCKRDCATLAVIASIVVGVLAAFLQITGILALGTTALIIAFGIGVVFLAGLLAVAAISRNTGADGCLCSAISAALTGALLTVLFAVVLLVIPVVTDGLIGAILIGILAASLTLLLTATACIIRCLTGCES